jgi:hypothetical protein
VDSTESNKAVVRRFILEVVNTGDVEPLREIISAECVETDGKVRIQSGLAGMMEHIRPVS